MAFIPITELTALAAAALRANGAATPRVVSKKSAACLIDAGNGLGIELCEFAVRQAIGRASQHGIGFAGVTNSHHCGALGILLEPVAAAGMVGLKGMMLAPAVELLCCALPGNRRHALAARAAKDGVEVSVDLENQLRKLARPFSS